MMTSKNDGSSIILQRVEKFGTKRHVPYFIINGHRLVRFSLSRSCVWCGGPFIKYSDRFSKSKEHIVPVSHKSIKKQGLEDGLVCLLASHRWCNSKRGNRVDWLPYYESFDNMTNHQQEWLNKIVNTLPVELDKYNLLEDGSYCNE